LFAPSGRNINYSRHHARIYILYWKESMFKKMPSNKKPTCHGQVSLVQLYFNFSFLKTIFQVHHFSLLNLTCEAEFSLVMMIYNLHKVFSTCTVADAHLFLIFSVGRVENALNSTFQSFWCSKDLVLASCHFLKPFKYDIESVTSGFGCRK
jgi:hypothetical protein